MDSVTFLLDTIKDQAPIFDSEGELKGKLIYSIEPKVFDEEGEQMNLIHIDHINDLVGRNMSI